MKKIFSALQNRRAIVNLFFIFLATLCLLLGISFSIKNKIILKSETNLSKIITKLVWKFGRSDGSLIAERIKFLPNNKISGYGSANEVFWGIKEEKYFVFYNHNRQETTIFTNIKRENGKLFLSGEYIFDRRITHILEETGVSNNPVSRISFIIFFIFVIILFSLNINFVRKKIASIFDFIRDKNNFRLISAVTIAGGILILLYSAFVIPPSMDEFLPYHQFARFFFPDSKEHKFREPANDSFDIRIFGLKLPLRAYPYIGYSESLRYLPFYLISRSYISARIMKLILILLSLFALWKVTKIPLHFATILVLFNLPLIFQMIVDTGPVAYQIMIALLIPLIIKETKNVFFAILSGILLYFAFEIKTIFFYLSFPIAVVSFFLIINDFIKESKKEKIKRIIFVSIIIISFLIPTVITITGKTKYGSFYCGELIQSRKNISIIDFEGQYARYKNSFKIYFDSFMNFGHRVYGTSDDGKTISYFIFLIILAFFVLFIIVYIYQKEIIRFDFLKKNNFFINEIRFEKIEIVKYKYKKFLNSNSERNFSYELIMSFVSFFSFAFIFININRMSDSWAGHHIILSFPFLILSIAFAVKAVYNFFPKTTIVLFILLMFFNSFLTLKLVSKNPLPTDDKSKIKILNYLNKKEKAQKNLYVIIDWGMYYISSIYGPKEQIVLYIDPLTEIYQLKEVENIAKRKNRDIFFILRKNASGDTKLISSYFGKTSRIIDGKMQENDLWQIWSSKIAE
ncbi:MAG TPA: hypothetical protein PLO89_01235 [Spirochaetota bacterium]|mgnify:CR=1 FL=1|nr:hypothetical protein [Spirochaetota bacterium]